MRLETFRPEEMVALPMKWIFFILILFAIPSRAETLAQLEAITARYATLAEFLADESGVAEYREALKDYMGESESFDPVYAEFIRQISEVNNQIDGFGEKAWRSNSHWQAERFSIIGAATGSGLESKREDLLTALETFKQEVASTAGDLIGDESRITALVEELKSTYGLESPEKLELLSRAQRAE